jgi:hypothetical protein
VYNTKYIYIQSTTVYAPSSELGLSHSLSRQRVCPSPQNQRGGEAHTPGGEGLGSPNSENGRKSLALCLLQYLHERNKWYRSRDVPAGTGTVTTGPPSSGWRSWSEFEGHLLRPPLGPLWRQLCADRSMAPAQRGIPCAAPVQAQCPLTSWPA